MLYCSTTDGSTTASYLGHSAIIKTCTRLHFSCCCTLKSIHLHTHVHTHSHSHTCTVSLMNMLTWNYQTGNPTLDFLLTAGCQCYICGFHFSLLGDILCHCRTLSPNEKRRDSLAVQEGTCDGDRGERYPGFLLSPALQSPTWVPITGQTKLVASWQEVGRNATWGVSSLWWKVEQEKAKNGLQDGQAGRGYHPTSVHSLTK